MNRRYLFILAITGLMISNGCNDPSLKSVWKEAQDDNAGSPWENSLTYVLEEENVTIGIQNDADNLYIALRATNRETFMKVMRTGLIIWLDATGKKKKVFGLHYPVGAATPGAPFVPGPGAAESPGGHRKPFEALLDSMEIIGPTPNDRRRIPVLNQLGISASQINIMGTTTLDLKIPLRPTNDTPFAIGVDAGSTIGLGLETGKIDREMVKKPRREGKGGFGRGAPGEDGMPGGPGRGGGPPRGENERARNIEPINFWAKVILAAGRENDNPGVK